MRKCKFNYSNDIQPSFDFEEFNILFDPHEISTEELASAYLVVFFNGNITQKVYNLKICGSDSLRFFLDSFIP